MIPILPVSFYILMALETETPCLISDQKSLKYLQCKTLFIFFPLDFITNMSISKRFSYIIMS